MKESDDDEGMPSLVHDSSDSSADDTLCPVLLEVAEDPALAFSDTYITEFTGGELVAPVSEGPFRELHDVALVHQGDVALVPFKPLCVLDRLADMALAAVLAHGFNPDA